MHRFNTKLNAFFEGQMFPVLFIGQPWGLQLNECQTIIYRSRALESCSVLRAAPSFLRLLYYLEI